MYTLSLNSLGNIQVFHKEAAIEGAPGNTLEVSETRKAEIMTMVEQALGTGDKHEAIALAMKGELDQYLNDPSIVLKMIDYAQEKGKSALTVLAMSKRFATLINDPTYFSALSNIENRLIKDKQEIIGLSHEGSNQIKATVKSRVRGQVV